MSLPRTRDPRGFIMIMVLLVVVALTAAVVGQLVVVQSQQLATLRDSDQVKARAIMDHCFQRGRMYLDQLRNEQHPADFDLVLDPLGNSHTGTAADFDDDFVPLASFGGSIVHVPAAESGQSGLRRALHHYRFVSMDGGACLLRFDDNTDDARVGSGADPQGIEGHALDLGGVDVSFRDRDFGIFITAIGIFPVAAATPPEDAYGRARGRATTKVFIGAGGAPGVVAHEALKVQSDIAICGQGGFQGNTLTYLPPGDETKVCACGDTAHTDVIPDVESPVDCAPGNFATHQCSEVDPVLPCLPGSDTTLSTAPVVNVDVPTPVNWLELSGFEDPRNPQTLGNNGICEFYFRLKSTDFTWDINPNDPDVVNDVGALMNSPGETGEIFVWDHTDDDAQGCTVAGLSLRDCPDANVVTHNCITGAGTTYLVDGKAVLKRPCKWDGGNETTGPIVTCPILDPDDLTPCWKLVDRVTTSATKINSTTFGQILQQDYLNDGVHNFGIPLAGQVAIQNIDDNSGTQAASPHSPISAGDTLAVQANGHGLLSGDRIVIRAGAFSGTYSVAVVVDANNFVTSEEDTTPTNQAAVNGVATGANFIREMDLREDSNLLNTGVNEAFAPKELERVPNIAAIWGDPPAADVPNNNDTPAGNAAAAVAISAIDDDDGDPTDPISVTTSSNHGLAVDDLIEIAGTGTPGAPVYDGRYTVATVVDATHFVTRQGDFVSGDTPALTDVGTVHKLGMSWNSLCGACPNCDVAEPSRDVLGSGAGDGVTSGWGAVSDEHFHFEQLPMCTSDFFSPSILVFENQVQSLTSTAKTGRFHVKTDWGTGCPAPSFVKHTVIAQGVADIDLNTRICGVWSDCSSFAAATTEPCTAANRDLADGFVVRAGGGCWVDSGAVFIGDMQCANIEINDGVANRCNIGDLIAFNSAAETAGRVMNGVSLCEGGEGVSCQKGICMEASSTIVGNLISNGDICLKNGAKVFGSALAGSKVDGTPGNVFINTGGIINGQLVSEGSIVILSDTVINNNGTGIFGTRVTSGIASEGSY